jgi:hypothetical protein
VRNIVTIEWMYFGIAKMAQAAARQDATLHLFARNRDFYSFDLARAEVPDALVIHDVDTRDPADIRRALLELGPVDGVVTPTEHCGIDAYAVLEELGLSRQNPVGVRTVRDKSLLRQRLYELGRSASTGVIVQPGRTRWRDLEATLGVPFIIKDSAGSGSAHVWLIDAEATFDRLLGAIGAGGLQGELLAERYFVGPLFSVETVTWQGETRVLGVSGRILSPEPDFREEASSFPVALPAAVALDIETWIAKVLDGVGYDVGVTHTEFVMTSDGFEVIEINPRINGLVGGDIISAATGADIYETFVEMALGRRPAVLDADLTHRNGGAFVFLYPDRPGTFTGIRGAATFRAHYGEPILYQLRPLGTRLETIRDQSGIVGVVQAGGPTAEIALLNALSAAGKLTVDVDG